MVINVKTIFKFEYKNIKMVYGIMKKYSKGKHYEQSK